MTKTFNEILLHSSCSGNDNIHLVEGKRRKIILKVSLNLMIINIDKIKSILRQKKKLCNRKKLQIFLIQRTHSLTHSLSLTMLFLTRYLIVSRDPDDIIFDVKPKNMVQLVTGRSPGSSSKGFNFDSSIGLDLALS